MQNKTQTRIQTRPQRDEYNHALARKTGKGRNKDRLEYGDLAQQLWPEDKPKPTSLSDDFFARLGQKNPVVLFPDAGTGSFPNPPIRTNKDIKPNGVVTSLMPFPDGIREKRTPRFPDAWAVCEREYYYRVKREVSKAHAEMGKDIKLYAHEVETLASATRFVASRKKAIKRARKKGEESDSLTYQIYEFITGDGTPSAIVIANHAPNGIEIPTDRAEALTMFDAWLNTPPETRLNKHSQSYGHHWQGMKGNGAKKVLEKETGIKLTSIQLVSDSPLAEINGGCPSRGFIAFDDIDNYKQELKAVTKWKVRGGGEVLTSHLGG